MLLEDSPTHDQPETGASLTFRGDKWFEESFTNLRIDSTPGILDIQEEEILFKVVGRSECDPPTRGRGIDRVREQIEQGLQHG